MAERGRGAGPIGPGAVPDAMPAPLPGFVNAPRAGSHGPGAGGALAEAALIARSALFTALFYLLFVALMLGSLPLLLAPRRAVLVLARLWARASLRLLRLVCGTRVEFRGLEHRPRGAAILAVKHQSFLETFALLAVLDDFSYVLKRELTAIPLFGWYLRRSGQIAVERERHAGALPTLQKAVGEALARGSSVIIFPEGTRRPVGAEPAYKPGVALLCQGGTSAGGAEGGTPRVPCTPVALNTGLFWPRRSLKHRPGRVVIEFLPPLPTDLGKREFMKALERAIEGASERLAAEALAADPRLAEFAGGREGTRAG